ncbi:MAG: ethylbenzene dehydrogenase-related protein [Trueperaceae bacterium]
MPRPSPTPTHLFVGVVATVAILAASWASVVFGQASSAPDPRTSATARPQAGDAPLGVAMWNAYFGETGVSDPANRIAQPDETHMEVTVKAAHDGERIYFQYVFPTPVPSYYHDYLVYRDGAWVSAGSGPVGPEPHGLHEDRVTMLVDDGSVQGFANQGGWVTCHDDLAAPNMYAAADDDDVEAHPVLGDIYGHDEQGKYLPQSRDAGPGWWEVSGWDAMSLENLERYAERLDAGVFLDLWHWRSARSNPIGYSDNQYVFENRNSSPGTAPYGTNASSGLPRYMFDPEVTGFRALTWDALQAQEYGPDGPTFIVPGVNAVEFDPDHAWQEGDTLPRRFLRTPTDSRGAIEADGVLIPLADGTWQWQVTLSRALDTGFPQADKAFVPGRTYHAAVAVHRLGTGGRWHMVTLPFTVGLDTPADVTANRFVGDAPNWSAIPGSTRIAIYPGQTNWEWVTSDAHPGGVQVRDDSMSVVGCHDEIGLGAANKEVETYLAGLTPFSPPELTVSRPGIEPGNIVLWFVVAAAAILVIAVALGRLRRG